MQASEINREILQETETTFSLSQLLEVAGFYNYAIAAWKDAGKENINVILDLSDRYKIPVIPDLENMEPGFLISPFLNESNHICYLIKADIHLKGKDGKNFLPVKSFKNTGERLVNELVSSIYNKNHSKNFNLNQNQSPEMGLSTESEFKSLVRLAIDRIREGNFLKVVPSRKESIDLPEYFNLPKTFIRLTRQYPDAFVSFFSVPGKGTWLGASPEILVEIDGKGIFKTSAVAGTQLWNPQTELSSVAWTQKEIEEQAYVSRYIINSFKKIRLREFDEYGPKTIRAGNLVHLRTDFTVNVHEVNFPQLGSVMLKLLHPTSAVCGMPKEASANFLRIHEKYNREFYSGYIGPVNIESKTGLYVNLRCAQLIDQKAYLYAGAGITIDSDPEKEWKETLIKNQPIQEILLGVK